MTKKAKTKATPEDSLFATVPGAEPTVSAEAPADQPGGPAGKGELIAAPRKRGAAKGQPAGNSGPPQAIPVPAVVGITEMIERLAGVKEVDAEKFERLLQIQERLLDRQARVDFDRAMIDAAPELPVLTKDGRIVVEARDRPQGGKTRSQATPYAKWETVLPLIKPVLARHGLAITHRIGTAPDGRIRVTAVLRGHGHTDDSCYFDLPADTGGSKNNVQAWASSVSYAKRHTAFASLGLVAQGEDDDGKSAGRPVVVGEALNDEELARLCEFRDAVGCPNEHLIKHLSETRPKGHPELAALADLPRSRLEEAIADLRSYEANKKEREGKKAS